MRPLGRHEPGLPATGHAGEFEGNAAHWVFAEMLAGRPVSEGMQAPNGVFITDEMIEGGELVVVRARMPVERFGPPRVEEPVAIPNIHLNAGHAGYLGILRGAAGAGSHRLQVRARSGGRIRKRPRRGIHRRNQDMLAAKFGEGPGLFDQRLKVNFTVIQLMSAYTVGSYLNYRGFYPRSHQPATNAAEKVLAPNPGWPLRPGSRRLPSYGSSFPQQVAYYDVEFAVKSSG